MTDMHPLRRKGNAALSPACGSFVEARTGGGLKAIQFPIHVQPSQALARETLDIRRETIRTVDDTEVHVDLIRHVVAAKGQGRPACTAERSRHRARRRCVAGRIRAERHVRIMEGRHRDRRPTRGAAAICAMAHTHCERLGACLKRDGPTVAAPTAHYAIASLAIAHGAQPVTFSTMATPTTMKSDNGRNTFQPRRMSWS